MAETPRRPDDNWGIGEMAGGVKSYPMSELPRLIAERDALLSDESETEELFADKKPSETEADPQAEQSATPPHPEIKP